MTVKQCPRCGNEDVDLYSYTNDDEISIIHCGCLHEELSEYEELERQTIQYLSEPNAPATFHLFDTDEPEETMPEPLVVSIHPDTGEICCPQCHARQDPENTACACCNVPFYILNPVPPDPVAPDMVDGDFVCPRCATQQSTIHRQCTSCELVFHVPEEAVAKAWKERLGDAVQNLKPQEPFPDEMDAPPEQPTRNYKREPTQKELAEEILKRINKAPSKGMVVMEAGGPVPEGAHGIACSDYARIETILSALAVTNPNVANLASKSLEIVETLIRKNRDYGASVWKSPLLAPNLPPSTGILVRMSDKIERLINLLKTPAQVPEETWEDTFRDLIGYALLYLSTPANPSPVYEETFHESTGITKRTPKGYE